MQLTNNYLQCIFSRLYSLSHYFGSTSMTAVPPLEAADQPVEKRETARAFNYYPLLGVLLAILMAGLTYGGLFLLLGEIGKLG